jgi:low affinity Fe/Cu permease
MKSLFRKFANKVSFLSGSAGAFVAAILLVIGWAVTGPLFDFSNTWQLFINTGTTIMTFLMVFLIQNTQNRDGKAVQLKLDELILATRGRDALVDLEDMTDDDLAELDKEFRDLHEKLSTSSTMKKLHSKVELEHKLRKEAQSKVFDHLNPLSHRK